MNVLVTGGAGFIGSHVTDALLAAGHYVVVVDNLHTGVLDNVRDGVPFYAADICDAAQMAHIFERENIELVSHQAALANVRESMDDPCEYARVNVVGSLVLLDLARRHSCRKFVFASTGGAVYGEGASPDNDRLPFTEKSIAQPKDNYGANKLSVEFHLDLYHQNFGLDYIALRYPNVYGPRQNSGGEAGVVAILADAMINNRPTRITGQGNQTRDFAFVSDIARANLLALTSDACGIFNVGTGVPTSIKTIYQTLSSLIGYQQQPQYVPQPAGEVLSTYLNNTKAASILGWTPQIELQEGLRRTVDHFVNSQSAAVG